MSDLSDFSQQIRFVEALVFSSSAPLDEKTIAARLPEGTDVQAVLSELKMIYQERGVQFVKRGNAWAFRTAEDLGEHLRIETIVPKKLSRASLETLSVIAYHQPVTRAEIENIRGVAVSKGTLDLLMEEGWITIGRRREIPGRPVTWKTTQYFLDSFGIEDLKDLPGLSEIKAAGLLDTRPAIDVVGGVSEQTKDMFDDEDNLPDNEDDDFNNPSMTDEAA